jgi:signal transduction histidine kinase
VPPGKYNLRFRVSGSSFGTVTEKNIRISIAPPWWQTVWAYSLYGLLFISGIFAIDRLQRRRLLDREREKAREKALEQAKEIKKAYDELEEAHRDLKDTQSQLIQSEKMASLGELTAGIAHEIQNPLNFVNNFSEVNKELIEELSAEWSKRWVDGDGGLEKEILNDIRENEIKIQHHGKRAEAIVKSMLLHSRSSSGQKELTSINGLCDEYLRLAFHGFRAKHKSFNAEFRTDLDPDLPEINIVPQDIGRVLLNLINNAFYAVSEKAEKGIPDYRPLVVVSTKKMNDKIEISVKDNGEGIPEQVRDKIFQPFFTTKPSGQGTGLGLSLSYDIVTKGHNGTLEVDTEAGLGSEFIIKLPCIFL